jgi:hypothetical protein
VAWQRPRHLPRFSWPSWLGKTAAAPLALILITHLSYTGVLGGGLSAPDDPVARALADHLTKTGARMYGASWCPHCKDQKALFGSAASRLPYVECSPQGQGTPVAAVCKEARIESYPTWVINGERIESVLTLTELGDKSGFKAPTPAGK